MTRRHDDTWSVGTPLVVAFTPREEARSSSPRAFNPGFSLLELMVVVTIVVVLAVAVTPVFRGSLAKARQDQAARDLVAYVKFGQEQAVAQACEYRLYLDVEGRTFSLMREAETVGRGEENERAFVTAQEPYAGPRRLPEGVSLGKPKARRDRETDTYYVAFYPTGACDFATIRLTGGRRSHVDVTTEGHLGRLKVASK